MNPNFKSKAALMIGAIFLASIFKITAQNPKTEILWDNYGIPHIYANTTEEMYYAFGWSQMQNHADLLLKLYGQSRGKAAEYWGKLYENSDRQIWRFDIPGIAKKNFEKLDKDFKKYLQAFVNGINDYAKSSPEIISKQFRVVLPVTVTDIMAHNLRVQYVEFIASLIGRDIPNTKALLSAGSNAIAIGPSRSATKNSLLLSNPHLGWSDYFLFFEADLSAPGFHAYGVTLIGIPTLGIAFNENLGWSCTINTIDASDRYELTLKDDGYLLDGKVLPFEKRTVGIKTREDNGVMTEQKIEFKLSRHGPILGEKNGKAYAIRIAGMENANWMEQWYKMARAKNLTQFQSALKMMQIPIFNFIYADKAGHIMYQYNGSVPKRTKGDWTFWNGTIDGRLSKYIWNGLHAYADLPKVIDPNTGFVMNANDPPWTCTYPLALDPGKYPAYISSQLMGLRPQRGVNMIKNDSSITIDELIDYKMNTGVEAAYRFLDDLFEAVKQYPDTLAEKATMVLKQWDRTTNSDSHGAVLFMQWASKLKENMYAKAWSIFEPISTPRGLNNYKQAKELLVQAALEVQKKYGSLYVAWGEVNRFRIGNMDYPANGGAENLGIYRSIQFVEDKDKKNRAISGDTYIAVIEFGKKINSQGILSYGNATQTGNRHIGDQLLLFSQKKLRPILFYREEVIKQIEKTELLEMSR